MAIKVNGTTVIDDSRNLVNIASGAGSSTTYGDVGTYVFGTIYNTGGVVHGSTYAGSLISPAGLDHSNLYYDNSVDSGYITRDPSTLSGTWRGMGRSRYYSGSNRSRVTLFVRVS